MPRRRPATKRRRALPPWALALLLLLPLTSTLTCAGVAWWLWAWLRSPDPVARVLFCETAGATHQERLLVAGVMKNRIRQPAFGNLATLRQVAQQPGAFSCIDDPDNTNWARSRHPTSLTPAEQAIWQDCLALAHGPIPAALGPSGRPLVYYHDKSITKPRSWDNHAWHAIPERTTPHFVFYSIISAGK